MASDKLNSVQEVTPVHAKRFTRLCGIKVFDLLCENMITRPYTYFIRNVKMSLGADSDSPDQKYLGGD